MKVKVLNRNPDNYLRETKRDIHRVPRNYDPSLHPFEAAREYTRALNAVKLERVFAKPFVGNLDGHQDGVSCLGKHPSRLSLLVSGAYDGETILTGVSHHQKDPMFATCGEICQIWEEDRSEPIRTFTWGVDNLHDVSFNPVETHLLAACAADRSIILYDTREIGPVRKVIMSLKSNKVCWNPMEAFIFTCASEDYNLYTFDTRKLQQPLFVHMDHVSAVTGIDYAPTGKEFVSGGYDKTVRIFETGKHHSRDVYHTKRMQRLTCVLWSMDNKYILCGSDEMNIRIWKARSAEKLGVLKPRERTALNYNEALKQKFAGHPQVSRIARHRHVPKHIYHAQKELRTIKLKDKRKESNRRAHSKPGSIPFVSEKKKHVVKEQT
ncbi:DDB1- and CUL4-associated factor 13 [Blattella germanica]|nr:DDB1- and CUL4-associated factor 13 [Blattella germanica]